MYVGTGFEPTYSPASRRCIAAPADSERRAQSSSEHACRDAACTPSGGARTRIAPASEHPRVERTYNDGGERLDLSHPP